MRQLRQSFISKWGKVYFKMGQLFQSGKQGSSKWGKLLFQSGVAISKWDNCLKVKQNRLSPKSCLTNYIARASSL